MSRDGRPCRDLRWPLREAGALLQARAFHPGRAARARLAALAAGNAIARARVQEVPALTGLQQAGGKRAGTFSLGMAQRLGIAAALLGDPGVLLLDEPVNGLDPEGIWWIRGLLRSLAAQGRAVLVSSHLISQTALMADHLVVIGPAAFLAFFAGRTALGHGIAAPALGQPGVLRTILLSGASVALIGLPGLGLGAIIRHTAAVTVLVSVVYAGELFIGQLNRTIDAYLPAYIAGDTLGGHTCGPGAAACPLPAWAGMSVLAAYAAAALLIGGCILACRDA